jgi:hypothetical protein
MRRRSGVWSKMRPRAWCGSEAALMRPDRGDPGQRSDRLEAAGRLPRKTG